MQRRFTPLLALLLLAAAATAAPAQLEAALLVPGIDITTWPDAPFRWRDIATTLYAESYRLDYDYAQAVVRVDYDAGPALTFAGHLSARGLKPNFAYQMKLVGKPSALWGQEGDDVSNVNLGFTGRWWRNLPTPGNSSDAEYLAHLGDPDWVFEGYLLFGFFVTDHLGTAEVDFAMDSSFHVLWWQHQRSPGGCDSPVLWHEVVGHAEDPAYDGEVGPIEVGVYAEIERLCYGESSLPPGDYHCRFLLTEESFHQSGDTEGYSASALVHDALNFAIVDPTAVDLHPGGGPGRVQGVSPNPGREDFVLSCRLDRPAELRLTVHDLRGRELHRAETPSLAPGTHQFRWDGRDPQGRPLPTGIYCYRITAAGASLGTGKLVLLH